MNQMNFNSEIRFMPNLDRKKGLVHAYDLYVTPKGCKYRQVRLTPAFAEFLGVNEGDRIAIGDDMKGNLFIAKLPNHFKSHQAGAVLSKSTDNGGVACVHYPTLKLHEEGGKFKRDGSKIRDKPTDIMFYMLVNTNGN